MQDQSSVALGHRGVPSDRSMFDRARDMTYVDTQEFDFSSLLVTGQVLRVAGRKRLGGPTRRERRVQHVVGTVTMPHPSGNSPLQNSTCGLSIDRQKLLIPNSCRRTSRDSPWPAPVTHDATAEQYALGSALHDSDLT